MERTTEGKRREEEERELGGRRAVPCTRVEKTREGEGPGKNKKTEEWRRRRHGVYEQTESEWKEEKG